MLNGHGGNIYKMAKQLGCDPSEIIDMSSNVNPLGPLPGLVAHLMENINTVAALPEVDAQSAVNAFCGRFNVDPECVAPGNGTTQFIYAIPRVLETRKALILGPTYADYADACLMNDVPCDYLMTRESDAFAPDLNALEKQISEYDTVFICNPNNPTGTLIPVSDLERLCASHRDTRFIIDESYLPFADGSSGNSMMRRGFTNVLVLNSLSKFFRIPGLRIGFLISSPAIIEKFRASFLPWNVNSLAQVAVKYLMTQTTEVDAFAKHTLDFFDREKSLLTGRFKDTSHLKFFPSTTSFLLARLYGDLTADRVGDMLSQDRVLIRNCSNFKGLSDKFIRISLQTGEINQMVADRLLNLARTGKI
jgi:threonine-phosphate decarboxylase